jgi:hypothetical protein
MRLKGRCLFLGTFFSLPLFIHTSMRSYCASTMMDLGAEHETKTGPVRTEIQKQPEDKIPTHFLWPDFVVHRYKSFIVSPE